MKKLLLWFVFGVCICLVLNVSARPSATPSQPSARLGGAIPTVAPVAVPEPSAKAVSFNHSIMLLIAVLILWNPLIPVGFLFTGFSAKLRSWAERLGRRWYFSYAIYYTAFCLIYLLLLLPFAYFGGFVLLHHYDLSNQSFARWLSNSAKSAVILLLIGLAVGWVPFFIIKKSPRRWWLYLGLLTPLYLCFTLWIQPVLINPLFHKFTPLQNKELEAKILAEATRAGIQGVRVYQVNTSIDSKMENAYVTGLMGTQRIVFYDTLLRNMNEDELLFIMGHEMGHYVLGHRAKKTAFRCLLVLVSLYVAYLLAGPVIGRFKNRWGFAAPSDFAALPLGLLAFWLFCFVYLPFDMAFSRYREHEADRFGLELTHANHAAATVFAGLMQRGLDVPRPGAIFTIWFDSHPCIADRIEFCNTYHPWEIRQPSKYEKYFLPAAGSGGPTLSSLKTAGIKGTNHDRASRQTTRSGGTNRGTLASMEAAGNLAAAAWPHELDVHAGHYRARASLAGATAQCRRRRPKYPLASAIFFPL